MVFRVTRIDGTRVETRDEDGYIRYVATYDFAGQVLFVLPEEAAL